MSFLNDIMNNGIDHEAEKLISFIIDILFGKYNRKIFNKKLHKLQKKRATRILRYHMNKIICYRIVRRVFPIQPTNLIYAYL